MRIGPCQSMGLVSRRFSGPVSSPCFWGELPAGLSPRGASGPASEKTLTSSIAPPLQTNRPGPGTRREGFACVSVAASRGGVFTVPPDATVGFSKPTEMLCGLPLAGILFPVTWQPSVHAPARARLPAPSPTPARASSRDRRGLPPACFPQPRKRSVARAPRALPLF